MGNKHGIAESILAMGSNKIVEFDGGRFSFAHNDEIALVLDSIDAYFILNCDSNLFEEVKKKIKGGANKTELVKFWKEIALNHDVSDWSNDFSELL